MKIKGSSRYFYPQKVGSVSGGDLVKKAKKKLYSKQYRLKKKNIGFSLKKAKVNKGIKK